MKYLPFTVAAVVASVVSAYDHPLFLVSRITEDDSWCATVRDDDDLIVLQPCDFDGAPPNQIWYRRDYEDFSSALFERGERCMGYTDTNTTFRLTDCFNDTVRTSFWQEYWKDGTAVQLSDYGEGPLCVAPADDKPSGGAEIQMLPCEDEGRYAWHFEYPSCLPLVSSGWAIRMCGEDGCAKAMNPGVRNASNRLAIVDSDDGDVWLFDSRFDDALCMGTGLMRLKSDPSLCLQQGHGGSAPLDGSWMRVYPCECNNPYQQFYCGEPGKTRTNPSLVMATNKDTDMVILRENDAADAYPLWPDYGEPPRLAMVLLWHNPGATRRVRFGDPVVLEDPQETDSFICLFQQGDGNLRILRSPSEEACNNNSGDLIFHTSFSRELAGQDEYPYFTQLQRDGNLVTRKSSSMEWVWSSCSDSDVGDYALVLNPDDTLSIYDENGKTIWNSVEDENCVAPARDPVVLLQATTGNIRKIRSGEKWTIPDQDGNPNFNTPVCLYQKNDGNFVVGFDGCESNESILFQSGLSKQLPEGEKYYTALQNDGNLVTREADSRKWVWKSCSRQANPGDFSLVLNEDNSLSIVSWPDGEAIWNSAKDSSCVAK